MIIGAGNNERQKFAPPWKISCEDQVTLEKPDALPQYCCATSALNYDSRACGNQNALRHDWAL